MILSAGLFSLPPSHMVSFFPNPQLSGFSSPLARYLVLFFLTFPQSSGLCLHYSPIIRSLSPLLVSPPQPPLSLPGLGTTGGPPSPLYWALHCTAPYYTLHYNIIHCTIHCTTQHFNKYCCIVQYTEL